MNSELQKKLEVLLPPGCSLEKVELEGPDLVVYINRIDKFYEAENPVRDIASGLKKKIIVRTAASNLLPQDEAKTRIDKLVPAEGGVSEVRFCDDFHEVWIEALKPGLVIGKGGMILKEIIKQTGWAPRVLRMPTIPSEVIKGVRGSVLKESAARKKFLSKTAKRIFTTQPKTSWVKSTALGGFKEVGRSAMFLQTSNDKILIDCGVNPDTTEPSVTYPYLSTLNLPIDEIDAVVLTHAHLDHCLHPDSYVQLADGNVKRIEDVVTGTRLPAADFGNTWKVEDMPCIQRGELKAPATLIEVRTKTKRIKVTPDHKFFVLDGAKLKTKEAQQLKAEDFIAVAGPVEFNGSSQRLPAEEGFPTKTSEEVCQIIGYILGDGTKMGGRYSTVCVTDKDIDNLDRYAKLIEDNFGLKIKVTSGKRNRLKNHNIRFRRWLEKIEQTMLEKSRNRRVPELVCKATNNEIGAFLRGLFDAEGSVKHHSIVLSSSSENIIHVTQTLLQRLHIVSHIYDMDQTKSTFKGGPMYQLAISDPTSIKNFLGKIGFSDTKKQTKAKRVASKAGGVFAPRIGLIPLRSAVILSIAEKLGMRKSELREHFNYLHYVSEHYPSRNKLSEVILNLSQIAQKKGVQIEELDNLMKVVSSEVEWEPVTGLNWVKADCKYVYDLTVPGHSNYIANGIIVHNCGFIPYLFAMGYEGPTYMTPPSRDLMALLCFDYIKVMKRTGATPAYTEKDVRKAIAHTITRDFGEVTDITPEIKLTFHNAGHILGSAMAHLHVSDGLHNLVYTGDIKFGGTRLLNSAATTFPRIEALFMESTYGGRDDVTPTRIEAEQKLTRVVQETINRKGKVLIPVFSVGRSQEVMLVLEDYARKNKDFNVKIYLDGMVREASAIHTVYPEYLRDNVQRTILSGHSPFESPIFELVKGDRQEVAEGEPCVILAPSGMLSGGPSVGYLKLLAENPNNTLIFVGYQAVNTLGRKIQRGDREVATIGEDGRLESIKINMRVETCEGFSGHSDRRQLIAFARSLRPKPAHIYLMHGEESKCEDLAGALSKILRVEARAPMNLDGIRLK